MKTTISSGKNPYVGPQPFPPGQPLFGRDREILEIKYLLTSERIVLLYSPSGAGKSSLVNAGLRGRLAQRFEVLGPTRVNSQHIDHVANRYVWSAISGIEGSAAPPDITWQSYLEGKSWKKNPLILFDQFEEILRVDPWDAQGKKEFFEQLGQALRDPHIWALFVLREDYVAPLDPYAHLIPTNFYNRYRLDRLTIDMAVEAIEKPTAETTRKFAPGVVQSLAENLAKVKVNQADGTTVEKIGDYVEPLQLQVVCFDLWARMADDRLEIDMEGVGDVGDALSNYYTHCVEAAAAGDKNAERRIRDWFNDKLITAEGVRNQVRQGTADSGGLENALVRELVDTYLIRPEPRGGSIWYELSHDRLVDPIRHSNRNWLSKNLIPVQQHAVDWVASGKSDSLLLDDAEFAEAELWAKDSKTVLLPHEKEFLQACRIEQRERQMAEELVREGERFHRMEEQRLRTEEKLRQASRFRKLSYVAATCAVVAIGFAILSGRERQEANRAEDRAKVAARKAGENADRANEQKVRAEKAEGSARKAAQEAEQNERIAIAERIRAEAAERSARQAEREADDNAVKAQMAEQSAKRDAARALRAESEAKEKAKLAISGRLAEAALQHRGTRPGLAGLLSLEAIHAADGFDARHALLSSLQAHIGLIFPLQHDGAVSAVAYSPDGKLIASASVVTAAAAAPAANASGDRTVTAVIRLWGVESRAPVATLPVGHAGDITSIAFSPDGKLLASASADRTVRLWDVAARRASGPPLKGHTGEVLSLAFSPTGGRVASASADGTVRLWNLTERTEDGAPLKGHQRGVLSVAFSADGMLLATGGEDRTVRLWDPDTQEQIGGPLQGHGTSVTSVVFGHGGRLASAAGDGAVRLWKIAAPKPESNLLIGHSRSVRGLAFDPNGAILASAGADQTVRLWDATSGQPLGDPLRGHSSFVTGVAFHPNGNMLASSSVDGSVRLLPKLDGRQSMGELAARHVSWVAGVAFSEDNKLLASAGNGGMVQLTGVENRKLVGKPWRGDPQSIFGVALGTGGKLLATGGSDHTIRLWDTERQVPEGEPLKGHTGLIRDVAISPKGRLVASASNDQTVRLWSLVPGERLSFELKAHTGQVTSVAFSPNGKVLASGSNDFTVRLWDVEKREAIGEPIKGPGTAVLDVAFSQDGSLIAASTYQAVHFWNVERRIQSGTPLRVIMGYGGSIAFSPDGKIFASAGSDGAIRLWDVQRRLQLGDPLRGHTHNVVAIVFSPDGKKLASASEDRSVWLWDVDPDNWAKRLCPVIDRNLSKAEWSQYFPEEEYRPTCPQSK